MTLAVLHQGQHLLVLARKESVGVSPHPPARHPAVASCQTNCNSSLGLGLADYQDSPVLLENIWENCLLQDGRQGLLTLSLSTEFFLIDIIL